MAIPCEIRCMRGEEVELAIELAAREAWNPGLHDAAAFHAADPQGFLLAEVDGEFAGCIAAVAYGEAYGFIGLYIVRPEWRGRGIGWQLWSQGLQRLAGRAIGLDGVPAQQANYRRSGFELLWGNVRYAGVAQPAAGAALPAGVTLRALSAADLPALLACDRQLFPAPREAFLRSWIAQPDGAGRICLQGERPLGWGWARRCRVGHKVGPLLAETPEVAQALWGALSGTVPAGEPICLDLPLPNPAALELARRAGLQPVFETARMVRGTAPAIELSRVYGITSFELG